MASTSNAAEQPGSPQPQQSKTRSMSGDTGNGQKMAAPARSPSASGFTDANGVVSPHSLPPAVLRLLALSSPLITGIDEFLQLATWTGPNGGGTRSTLLLLAWTGGCLFAYPLLRYAPQLILLTVILGSAIPNVLLTPSAAKRGSSRQGKSSIASIPTLTASTLTQTQAVELLQKLSSILDVCSTLHAHLVLPVWQALTWQHPGGPSVTIGTAIVCLTLGSFWTLCFADWPATIGKLATYVPLDSTWQLAQRGSQSASLAVQQVWDGHFKYHYEQAGSPPFRRIMAFILSHARDTCLWVATRIGIYAPAAWSVTVLPPFPLFSLSLRHFFLAVGLFAFSWCSTYATLVRHALWKSAIIRRITRTFVRLVSAGYLGQSTQTDLARSLAATLSTSKSGGKTTDKDQPDRINTVSYRFELYENQRWWMGLDWTAALLPQERASWTDVNLAPVSPPSSFTLPSETVSYRPAPTKEKPNAWEKRTVRWKWEEEEWRVVVHPANGGSASVIGEDGRSLPTTTSSPRRSSLSSAGGGAPSTPTSGAGGAANTLFASFGKRASMSAASSSPRSPSAQAAGAGSAIVEEPSSLTDPFSDNASSTGEDDVVNEDDLLLEEETDGQGWRYGDNSWEKMTAKSGMGKYTRRRRWVRRARMEEIVETGLDAPSASERQGTKTEQVVKEDKKTPTEENKKLDTAVSSGLEMGSPAGGSAKRDLKSRLAGAANGGNGNSG
ncbi:unnamed protein product [Sympodiomycopsis kandeliae]